MSYEMMCDINVGVSVMSWATGALALITTVLIGWQVFSLIDYNRTKKELADTIRELTNKLELQQKKSDGLVSGIESTTRGNVAFMCISIADIYIETNSYIQAIRFVLLAAKADGVRFKNDLDKISEQILKAHKNNVFKINNFKERSILKGVLNDVNKKNFMFWDEFDRIIKNGE